MCSEPALNAARSTRYVTSHTIDGGTACQRGDEDKRNQFSHAPAYGCCLLLFFCLEPPDLGEEPYPVPVDRQCLLRIVQLGLMGNTADAVLMDRDHVAPRCQYTVECAGGGDEFLAVASAQHGADHRLGGGRAHAHQVAAAGGIDAVGAPVEHL